MPEQKHTKQDLEIMQAWPLERKIRVTQTRLMEWKMKYKGQIYISFSGGKDSTVLADLAARVYKGDLLMNSEMPEPLTLVFINTGLEYPEIQRFVREFADWLRNTYEIPVNLEILHPEMTFPEVISKYGYPVIGKEQSFRIRKLKHQNLTEAYRADQMGRLGKWEILLNAPFECSEQCCDVMKKRPAHKYEKATGKRPVIATMACESDLRTKRWLKEGCNAFDSTHPKSKPMSFWTEQDVLQYLKITGIPYAPVYGDIVEADPQISFFDNDCPRKLTTTGCDRTGCMFCMFGIGVEKEPNRFQRMKQTHPRQYAYCIGGGHYENGVLKPDKTGLGIGKILDFIEKPY